ncbi:MAG: hemolysin family protein [Butyrivibrio sp.]|nr:hemolysin family protein [Butyrivibrio sp.]
MLLSGFFSSAETAMAMANKVKIKTLADDGDKRAKAVMKINDDYQTMLSSILIGNNIVNLSASSLTTVLVSNTFGSMAIGVATGILTFVILVVGEIVPKTLATVYADNIALAYSKVILFLMRVLTPIVYIVNAVTNVVLKALRVDTNSKVAMTESELKTYVDVSHEDGVIETGEKEIIYNVFDFSDARAKDVMIPRIDMSCVAVDCGYHEVMRIFKQDMYTRIPVYEDNNDNIIGLINIKDMILVTDRDHFDVRNYIREAYYTYEFKKTADLLLEMRENGHSVAFVLDEYGATVGMITLEDLLEEIVGEIRDEYDSDEEELIKNVGEDRYLIEGSVKIDDINDAVDLDLDSEDYDSIGGLMIEKLDRLPRGGESITLDNGITLTARGIKRNRITKVLMSIPKDAYKSAKEAALEKSEEEDDSSTKNTFNENEYML